MESIFGCFKSRICLRTVPVVIAFCVATSLVLLLFHFSPEHIPHGLINSIDKLTDSVPNKNLSTSVCNSSAVIWHDAQAKYADLRDDKFTYVQRFPVDL